MPKFFIACPKCIEPRTTLEHGEHVQINVSATNHGAKCCVQMECIVCGTVRDITKEVNQISMAHFEELNEGKKTLKSNSKSSTLSLQEKILSMMTFNSFENWYKNDFISYICGDPSAKTRDEILSDIKQLMR